MQFRPFEHARFLAKAWAEGPPKHHIGGSALQGTAWGQGGFPDVDPDAFEPGLLDLGTGGELQTAIAARHGANDEQVLVTAGTTSANTAALLSLLEPGCNVVCERPTYTPLPEVARGLGAEIRFVDRTPPGKSADAWRLDPQAVQAACDDNTRAILLSSPNNPTGAVASKEDLLALGRIAADHDAHVLVDQVYRELTDHPVGATIHPRILTTAGFNKCWGAPALRTGWIIGDAQIIQKVRDAHQLTVMAAPPFGLKMGRALLEHEPDCRAALEARLAATHPIYNQWLESRHDIESTPATGHALVAFPRLTRLQETQPFAHRILRDDGIETVPGELFGTPGHVRIGLGGDPEGLQAGLQALGHALDRLR